LDPKGYTEELIRVLKGLDHAPITALANMIREAKERGATVYVFGNGGSGAASSHLSEDLGKMTTPDFVDHKGRLRILSLTDNTPYILCLANDLGYDQVFSQQLMNLARAGDIAIGISGSGNSKNVIVALEKAKAMGLTTVGILGYDGGRIKGMVDLSIHVRSFDMQICEDVHMHVIHQLVKLLMVDH
jgi:D-sedoheptulose 7-phosphate isomerase